MLDWFITLQVVEEKAPSGIIDDRRRIAGKGGELVMLDARLAERKAEQGRFSGIALSALQRYN